MERQRKLDHAERWLRDGFQVCHVPAYFVSLDVHMQRASEVIEAARRRGIRLTYTHLFVRAAALALEANPDLHKMVCGSRVHSPCHIDIALSVAGETAAAPLLVIPAADRKDLISIAEEITQRAPEVRAADRRTIRMLRRWGWVLPFGFLRRAVLRGLMRSQTFRRKGSGTFQVSVLTDVDEAMTPVFSTSAMLVAAGVKDKVVALNGKACVRPMVTLICCADHRVWDGQAGQRFLVAVRQVLEGSTLMSELDAVGPYAEPVITDP